MLSRGHSLIFQKVTSRRLKKVLFIVPYPAGFAPSQRFRFEQYFHILTANNIQFKTASFWSPAAWKILYKEGNTVKKLHYLLVGIIRRVGSLFSVRGYDFIFIHREALPVGPPVVEFIISKFLHRKIIYDFDDAIWLPNTSQQNSLAAQLKWHNKVKHICGWSWKISCGNDFLASFAHNYNSNVVVNPTTIDTAYHHPLSRNNSRPVIGWTGTHSTMKYLNALTPVLNELKKKYDFSVCIISNQKPDWEYHDFEFVKWSLDNEIETLNGIDIGIMPLEDSVWELGKCGFKALQYMALEIPAVASSVGANNKIIDHGKNGFLCSHSDDWIKYLSQLLVSEVLRNTLGKAGRQKVLEHYSVDSNTGRFLGLFE